MKIKKKLIIFSILFLFGFGVFFGSFAKSGYFVNAATDNYFYLGKYEKSALTSSTGIEYKLEVNTYIDYDNNNYKIIARILSTDAYIGDYSSFFIECYRTYNIPYNSTIEHSLLDLGAYSDTYHLGVYGTYIDLVDGLEMTYIIPCDMSSFYHFYFDYENYENDNDIILELEDIYLGYSPIMYENIIEGYKNIGYIEGTQETQEAKFWFVSWFEAIQRFLNIEFMGISIGTIVLIPFAISFVWFIIRQFRGGGGD